MTQRVTYKEWYGGMSNDKWQRRKGEYYFSNGIDVRNDGKSFGLYGFNKTTLTNPNGNELTSVLPNPDTGPDLLGFENGYLKDTNGVEYNTSISEPITDIAIYGQYGYLVHGSGVSRWNIVPSSNDLGLGTNGSNIDIDFYTFTGDGCASMFSEDASVDFAYVYGGKDIYAIDVDSATQALDPVYSFNEGDNVLRITRVGDNYNIYNQNSKTIISQSITTNSQTRYVAFEGYRVIDAINKGNSDIVIVEDTNKDKTTLMHSSGYEQQILYATKGGELTPYDNERIVFDTRFNNLAKMTKQGSIVYISGGDNNRLYSVGKQYEELGISLAIDYIGEYNINAIGTIEDGIVVGNTNNVDIIKLVDPEQNQLYEGYLETNPFVGQELGNKKRLKNIRIGYDIEDTSSSTANSYIKLYHKADNGAYELVETIDSDIDSGVGAKTITFSKEFHSSQFKIELYKEDVRSPRVFDITFTYDVITDGVR